MQDLVPAYHAPQHEWRQDLVQAVDDQDTLLPVHGIDLGSTCCSSLLLVVTISAQEASEPLTERLLVIEHLV